MVEVDLRKVLLVGGLVGMAVAWWLRTIWRQDLSAFNRSGE